MRCAVIGAQVSPEFALTLEAVSCYQPFPSRSQGPRMKLLQLFASSVVLTGLILLPKDTSAAAWPPHHSLRYIGEYYNCFIDLQHGNAFGGAYSKVVFSGSCGSNSHVQTVAWNGAAVVNGNVCKVSNLNCKISANFWQSFSPFSNILGTQVRWCNSTNTHCTTHHYKGL